MINVAALLDNCTGVRIVSEPFCPVSLKMDLNSTVPEVFVRDEPLKIIVVSVPLNITGLLESLRYGVTGPAAGAEAVGMANPWHPQQSSLFEPGIAEPI